MGQQAGQYCPENILTAGNTEAKDWGVSRPAGGGEIIARSRRPDGRIFREGGCVHGEGGLETGVPLGKKLLFL
jgi:hypothetical protein